MFQTFCRPWMQVPTVLNILLGCKMFETDKIDKTMESDILKFISCLYFLQKHSFSNESIFVSLHHKNNS